MGAAVEQSKLKINTLKRIFQIKAMSAWAP
jgi:hypothetical protein